MRRTDYRLLVLNAQERRIFMKKKLVSIMIAGAMALCLAGCGGNTAQSGSSSENSGSSLGDLLNSAVGDAVNSAVDEANSALGDAAEQINGALNEVNDAVESVGEGTDVMSYADYAAAELDSEVTVVTYVQDHQSWWDNKITVYTQDQDGAYFLYELPCSEEDAEKLVPGTKIKVKGYKSEWSGEVEITDSTFEFVEDGDSFIASAQDLTDKLGTDELINYQNVFASFNNLTVVARPSGNAFDYKWDNSGSHDENSDLYFDVQDAAGNTYTFTVESYLRDNTTAVYGTVENLSVGDVINCEGFVYWYEGVNPHITSVTVQ